MKSRSAGTTLSLRLLHPADMPMKHPREALGTRSAERLKLQENLVSHSALRMFTATY